jgi:PAS domain S-box-containing protein
MSALAGDGPSPDQKALTDALAYVGSIVDTIREPLLILDGRLRVQSANRAFYQTFQVAPGETEGRLLYDLGNRQWDIPRLRTLLEEILPQRTSFDDFEVAHDFPDIGRKVMLLNARKLRQAGTELILLALEDVTERRQAEAKRQEIETRFTSLVKNVKDHSIFTLDPDGRVTSWNVAAQHILGYTEDEVLGQHFAFIFTPEDRRQRLPDAELRAAREHGRAEDERWHLRKGGERFWALGIVSALHDAAGRLTGFSKILRDMTGWKEAEPALREREARLAAEADALSRLNAASSRLWRTRGLDQGLQAMLDATLDLLDADMGNIQLLQDERLHIAVQKGFGPDFLDFFREVSSEDDSACGRALRCGERTLIEDVEADPLFAPLRPIARAAGYRAVVSTPIPGRAGTPLGMISAYFRIPHRPTQPALRRLDLYARQAADFIERCRTETALRESEERFRALTVASADGVYRMSPDWSEVLYLRGREFIADTETPSRGWLDRYIPPQDQPHVCAAIQEAIRTKRPYGLEHRVLRMDGSLGWTLSRAIPMLDASGEIREWLGTARDITERKQAEEALRESESQYRQLVQGANSAIVRWRPDGTITLFNEYAQRFFGWPAEEVIGRHIDILVPDIDSTGADLKRLVEDIVRHPERYVNNVNENVCRDGRRVWMMWTNNVIRDASGRVTELLGIGNDITAQKRAEANLREANRRKDAFLATLAHELRNPLMPIRTSIHLLQVLRGDAAACEKPLEIMDRQLTHLVRLVDDLLDVSRISRGKIALRKERLELAGIVDAALEMSQSGLGRGNRCLTVEVPPEPLAVEGDRVRLVQVVANLLNNAAKFTDPGGHIALRVLPQGERVEVQVQDDGRGIPGEWLNGIFDMFAQAEPGRGGGLGIGLTLVRSLVALHGGSVSAHSDGPGRGATFTVALPLYRGVPAQPVADAPAQTAAMPRRRVLVVDDNRDVAESLGLLLTTLNAEVRVAHDGEKALQLCEDWSPTHVLMDLGMPGMDGYEAARRLRANHPERRLRLVAVSGWGGEEYRQQSADAGFDQHLVKPVGLAELTAVLTN